MEYLNVKNKKIRFFTKKIEKKMFIHKALQTNFNLGQLTKLKAILSVTAAKKTFFCQVAFVNRCILSKRKKRVNYLLNVSRLVFLNFARSGDLYGIRKAVW